MSEWFYRVMSDEIGPVTGSQLKQLAKDGTIEPDTHVRKGREGSWVTADHVQGLFPKLTMQLPAVAPSRSPNPVFSEPSTMQPNLTRCADCGGQISRRATTCPHCGAPVAVQAAVAQRPSPSKLQPAADWGDLRRLAEAQRALIGALFLQLVACPFLVLDLNGGKFLFIVGIGLFVLAIVVQLIFVFNLAINVFGIGGGIAIGIMTLIPCIGFVFLLIINGKATSVLTANGIKVGLLGASMSQF